MLFRLGVRIMIIEPIKQTHCNQAMFCLTELTWKHCAYYEFEETQVLARSALVPAADANKHGCKTGRGGACQKQPSAQQ